MDNSHKKILVPIDFSDITESVIDEAKQVGKSMDMDIILLHVETNPDDFVQYSVRAPGLDKVLAQHNEFAKNELDKHKQELENAGLSVETCFEIGPIHRTIIKKIDELSPDMVIVGSHGHGALYHVLMGSVCESVFKKAQCPVVVVPSEVTAGV